MSIEQKIWNLNTKTPLPKKQILEKELEDLLSSNIKVVDDSLFVIGRQVATEGGPLDLLCLDRSGQLTLVELKRDVTPRDIVAQALDYASCVDKYDAENIKNVYKDYCSKYQNKSGNLNVDFKEFFGNDLDEDQLNDGSTGVKVLLVATQTDKSTERILNFLRERLNGIEINIVFFATVEHAGEVLLSRAYMYDPIENDVKEKKYLQDWNHETYVSFVSNKEMQWEDCVKYGFIAACGGAWYSRTLSNLTPGDRIWINIPHTGYVGVGIVKGEKNAAGSFEVNDTKFFELPLQGTYMKDKDGTDEGAYVVPVEWIHTVPIANAVSEAGFFGNQNTVVKSTHRKWDYTVKRLMQLWGIK